MISLRHLTIAFASCLCALVASGCDVDIVSDADDPVYFSPLETDRIEPRVFEDPGAGMSAERMERVEPAIESFRTHAGEYFEKSDEKRRLIAIESMFVLSGHYLDLVGIYQDLVDKDGISSPAAPRLAWILVQLGQKKQARELVDRLHLAYPDRASTWFLEATYWLQEARQSREAAAKVAASFQKMESLDPDFAAFDERTTTAVRQQTRRIEQSLDPEAIEQAEETLDERIIELDSP